MDRKEFFDREIMPLYRDMYRMGAAILGDSDDAYDAVQQAMLGLWERIRPDKPPLNLRAYCLTTLRNRCMDMLKQRLPTSRLESVAEADFFEEPSTGDDSAKMAIIISQLPRAEQTVIRLSAFGGCSTQEIASAMGISDNYVRQLLYRGRKKIRALFFKAV